MRNIQRPYLCFYKAETVQTFDDIEKLVVIKPLGNCKFLRVGNLVMGLKVSKNGILCRALGRDAIAPHLQIDEDASVNYINCPNRSFELCKV